MPPRRAERVAVTGGTGLIGRALVRRLLDEGAEVLVLARDPVRAQGVLPAHPALRWQAVDLCDAEARRAIDLSGCSAVYHLAASLDLFGAPHQHALNVEASRDLGVAARDAGVPRFVFASSIEASGVAAPTHPRGEGEPGERFPYGESKREAEARLAAIDGLAVASARIGIVHGPADRWTQDLLAALRDPASAGELETLREVVVDCVHLDDVVEGLRALARASRAGTFHLTGGPLRVGAMLDALREAAALGAPRTDPAARARVAARVRDAVLARRGDLVTYLAWPEPARSSRLLSGQAIRAAVGFAPRRRWCSEELRRDLGTG